MNRTHFFTALTTLLLGGITAGAQKGPSSQPRFIGDIEMSFDQPVGSYSKVVKNDVIVLIDRTATKPLVSNVDIENASSLQLKYALLLDTEVEAVTNLPLFGAIDEWFGTPYRMGGTTRSGIDCSAFVQTLFSAQYGLSLPRTAKEQYTAAKQISRTELKQGDLVFFNTRGGVSHVGVYLQNNKFVHAASSGGVMISDLFDQYWVKRFIGVGRIEGVQPPSLFSQP